MAFNEHKLQVGIMTTSSIVWGPVILSSHSDVKIVIQTVRTGNCNYFSSGPTVRKNFDYFWNQQAMLYRVSQLATEMGWQRFGLIFQENNSDVFLVLYLIILVSILPAFRNELIPKIGGKRN